MIAIDYNRSARRYEWTEPESGEILTAPSGAAGKAQLFQAALSILDPDLADAAVRWINDEPYLERTVWKGAEIVANSGVELFPTDGRLLAKVISSDGYGRYSITNQDGYTVCECTHYQDGGAPLDANGQKTCKHIAALRLHLRTRVLDY
jgi:hypothetical protein